MYSFIDSAFPGRLSRVIPAHCFEKWTIDNCSLVGKRPISSTYLLVSRSTLCFHSLGEERGPERSLYNNVSKLVSCGMQENILILLHIHDTTDTVSSMHVVEGIIDLCKRLSVGDLWSC